MIDFWQKNAVFVAMKYALFLVALVMMSAFYVEGDDDGVSSLLGLFLLNLHHIHKQKYAETK